jgi:hypothetical protein
MAPGGGYQIKAFIVATGLVAVSVEYSHDQRYAPLFASAAGLSFNSLPWIKPWLDADARSRTALKDLQSYSVAGMPLKQIDEAWFASTQYSELRR